MVRVEDQTFSLFVVLALLLVFYITPVWEVKAQAPTDSSLIPKYETAQRLDSEAVELGKQGTAETRRKAIDKHSQAATVYLEVGSKKDAAKSLGQAGVLLGLVGDVAKGLEYLQNALALFRTVGVPTGEAVTLNYIGETH